MKENTLSTFPMSSLKMIQPNAQTCVPQSEYLNLNPDHATLSNFLHFSISLFHYVYIRSNNTTYTIGLFQM